jgi:hypothetical protein
MATVSSRCLDRRSAFAPSNGLHFQRGRMVSRCRKSAPVPLACSARASQKVFFVLGNAGTGKGTQCALLSSRFGLDHVSAGDLLRDEVSSGSERGKMIAGIMREGRIVPSNITLELLQKAIESTYVGCDASPTIACPPRLYMNDVYSSNALAVLLSIAVNLGTKCIQKKHPTLTSDALI